MKNLASYLDELYDEELNESRSLRQTSKKAITKKSNKNMNRDEYDVYESKNHKNSSHGEKSKRRK